jgi:hypothetical protein
MTQIKRTQNGKKKAKGKSLEEPEPEMDFGCFEVFRADNIHGHNRSIVYLETICEINGCSITERKEEYSSKPGVTIHMVGRSRTEYKIKVTCEPKLIDALDRKITNWDCDDEELLTALSTFCPSLIAFDLYAYDPLGNSWNGICIDAATESEFGQEVKTPHVLDVVAGVVLAMADDLHTARWDKMNTLRRNLLRYLRNVWLFSDDPYPETISELAEIGAELNTIQRGG